MTLKFSSNWLERVAKPSNDEMEATLAAVRILVDDENVTAYTFIVEGERRQHDGVVEEKVHIPVYFLAEWIAENWWPLLYEPRKSEGDDDVLFHSRHSILRAQHGFALPDLQFEPIGGAILIKCRARDASIPGVRFKRSATTVMSRDSTSAVLSAFVQGCVERLNACQIAATPLQQAWRNVMQTNEDQKTFCLLVGALGVDPYGASEELSSVIDNLYDSIGERALLDLCMASSERNILDVGEIAEAVSESLRGEHDTTLAPIEKVRFSEDKIAHPSWRRGIVAANNIRSELGISSTDRSGCDKFFDKLRISTASMNGHNLDGVVFTGAIDRVEDRARIVLLQSREEARRFAASRAVFLGMNSDRQSRRLVTNAMARDQQASRAFAAEMLVPSKYLREYAGSKRLGRDDVHDIARQWRAGADVVKYQAENNGIVVDASF